MIYHLLQRHLVRIVCQIWPGEMETTCPIFCRQIVYHNGSCCQTQTQTDLYQQSLHVVCPYSALSRPLAFSSCIFNRGIVSRRYTLPFQNILCWDQENVSYIPHRDVRFSLWLPSQCLSCYCAHYWKEQPKGETPLIYRSSSLASHNSLIVSGST